MIRIAGRGAAAAVAAVLLVGCGGQERTVSDGPDAAQATSVTGPAAVSHGGPVRDHVSFVDRLRGQGLLVEIAGSSRLPGLRPPGTQLRVTGAELAGPAMLESYNYDATDLGTDGAGAVIQDAGSIAPDGTPKAGAASWTGPAHWYRAERLLVLYAGSDPAVMSVLRGVLGAQFAGT